MSKKDHERNWRPPLLTDVDVAYELRCSVAYVRRLHEEGKLPAVKMGDTPTRWKPETVDAYIATLPPHGPNTLSFAAGVRKSNAGRRPDSSKHSA